MYKVLVVDDELSVRKGLPQLIDWENAGFTVADTAENGRDAMEKLKSGSFDLVITDIRMPVLSGLELIKTLHEGHPRLKIIVISGYSDFEYARASINCGASAYLLKSIDPDELLSALKTIKDDLDFRLHAESINEREYARLVKDKLLLKLSNGSASIKKVYDELASCGVHLTGSSYSLAIIQLIDFYEFSESDPEDAALLKFCVRNIMEEMIEWTDSGYVYEEDVCNLCALIDVSSLKSQEKEVKNLLNNLSSTIKKYLNVDTRVVFINCSNIPQGLKPYREKLQVLLDTSSGLGSNRLMEYDETAIEKKLDYEIGWSDDTLLFAVEFRNLQNIKLEIKKLADCTATKNIPKSILETAVINMFVDCSKIIVKYNGQVNDIITPTDMSRIRQYSLKPDMLINWLLQKCMEISEVVADLKQNQSGKLFEGVLQYIDQSWQSNISLMTLSEKFFVNPVYLGRLFKKEVGCSFNKYLNTKRLNYIKSLIASSTDYKISELAAKAGYNSLSYFYSIFESYEGISFSEYKKSLK